MTQRELHEVYATCWRNPTVILVHPGFYGESSMQTTAHHWHGDMWIASTLLFTSKNKGTWELKLIDTDHVASFVGMTPLIRRCTQADQMVVKEEQ